MSNSRMGLSFAQAEGAAPLPSQLELKTISPELSASLWAVIFTSFDSHIKLSRGVYAHKVLDDPWDTIMRTWWVTRKFKNIDEYPDVSTILDILKKIITSNDYIIVFDFIQYLIQRPECPRSLKFNIDHVLQNTQAAYRVIDNYILPISCEAEIAAITASLLVAQKSSSGGPKSHLRNAGQHLSAGEWAATVRESINAVEAAAKSIEPTASTLGPALTKLQNSISLNPAMSRAYGALYGYTSDEKGIRHALVFDDKSAVNERDAIFMYGACASFVAYLLSAQQALNA